MRPDVVTKEENVDRKKRGPRARPEVCNVVLAKKKRSPKTVSRHRWEMQREEPRWMG